MFRERIEKLCKDKGITLKDLIRIANLSDHSYTWKSTGQEPSLEIVLRICDSLNVPVEEFFAGISSEEISQDDKDFLQIWNTLSEREKDMIKQVLHTYAIDRKMK